MTRPLALIEGDLALPDTRPLSGLPPPFGSRPRPARAAPQPEAQRAAHREADQGATLAAQKNARSAVRHKTPVRKTPLPPGTLFRFFYKVRQPRDYSAHFNAQLAEARYYLDAGKACARSSRRDYLLGAAIFAVTGIALVCLLTTTVLHDTEKRGGAVTAQSDAAGSQEQLSPPLPKAGIAPVGLQAANPSSSMLPQQAERSVRRSPMPQATRAIGRPALLRHADPYKTGKALTPDVAIRHSASVSESTRADQSISHLSDAQIGDRLAMSQTAASSTQHSAVPMQHEGAASKLSTDPAPEQAALLNWAEQQRHASVAASSTTTTRASVPASLADATWNAAMTHRRITDNPHAFDNDEPRP